MSPEPVWRTMEDVLHCETYTGSFRRPTEREMLTTTAQEALWLQDTKETMSLNLSPFVGDQSDPLNLSHFVARQHWPRSWPSSLHFRAYRWQRREPLRGLLVPLDLIC